MLCLFLLVENSWGKSVVLHLCLRVIYNSFLKLKGNFNFFCLFSIIFILMLGIMKKENQQ